jgi:hypothetical protein
MVGAGASENGGSNIRKALTDVSAFTFAAGGGRGGAIVAALRRRSDAADRRLPGRHAMPA